MTIKKEHIPVIVALALPVLLVLIVAGLSVISNRGVRSSHDFVYSLSQSIAWMDRDCYSYRSYYSVDDSGHLNLVSYNAGVLNEGQPNDPCASSSQRKLKDAPDLYYYDSRQDTTKPMTLVEASGLVLTGSFTSPDGYTVDYRNGNSGFMDIFGGSGQNGVYLNQKNQHRILPAVENDQTLYGQDFSFVGWVK